MTYQTTVAELFNRFPDLQITYRSQFSYLGEAEPGPDLIFGSILIPALEKGLEEGNLRTILEICAFLEDAAESAREDAALETLIAVEVGEWLGWASHEERLAPWLGKETKRICGYVPGLATRRMNLQSEPLQAKPLQSEPQVSALRQHIVSFFSSLRSRK